jgi:hypothetical protein
LKPLIDRLRPDIGWCRDYFAALEPHATGGVYVNFLHNDEGEARVRAAYGDRYERLAAIKARYDPDNSLPLEPEHPAIEQRWRLISVDLDLVGGELQVRRGGGEEAAPGHPATFGATALQDWLQDRSLEPGPLFCAMLNSGRLAQAGHDLTWLSPAAACQIPLRSSGLSSGATAGLHPP